MARINLNVGSNANDGTGDTLRSAMQNVNTMFTEVYASALFNDGITISGNNISADRSNDDLVLSPSGTGTVAIVDLTVDPNTVRYASIVLSALGPCIRLASTISNLLLVASDIDMKYFALLYVAEAKESTTEVADDATVVVLSLMSEWFRVVLAVANPKFPDPSVFKS